MTVPKTMIVTSVRDLRSTLVKLPGMRAGSLQIASLCSVQPALCPADQSMQPHPIILPMIFQVAAAAFKREKASDWLPEYRPVSIVPPERTPNTVLERITRISAATLLKVGPAARTYPVWRECAA